MKLADLMTAMDYKVSDSQEFLWACFGPNARYMDFESEHAYVQTVFDTKTQQVYEVVVEPKPLSAARHLYRWTDPNFAVAYNDEAKRNGVDPHKAYDDTNWLDVDLESDILEKATAIFRGEPYDPDIMIELDLTDDQWLKLAMAAHERRMTLNSYVNHILRSEVRRSKSKDAK